MADAIPLQIFSIKITSIKLIMKLKGIKKKKYRNAQNYICVMNERTKHRLSKALQALYWGFFFRRQTKNAPAKFSREKKNNTKIHYWTWILQTSRMYTNKNSRRKRIWNEKTKPHCELWNTHISAIRHVVTHSRIEAAWMRDMNAIFVCVSVHCICGCLFLTYIIHWMCVFFFSFFSFFFSFFGVSFEYYLYLNAFFQCIPVYSVYIVRLAPSFHAIDFVKIKGKKQQKLHFSSFSLASSSVRVFISLEISFHCVECIRHLNVSVFVCRLNCLFFFFLQSFIDDNLCLEFFIFLIPFWCGIRQ